jgi:hypothetical protein
MSIRWYRSIAVATLTLWPTAAFAYIGPGAGFALVSSFVTLLVAFAAAFFAVFALPVRVLVRQWKRRRSLRHARVKKVIVLGLDGLDPDACEALFARGDLPHLRRLRDEGTYRRLGTSMPALSPVAWSTFATGADPSRPPSISCRATPHGAAVLPKSTVALTCRNGRPRLSRAAGCAGSAAAVRSGGCCRITACRLRSCAFPSRFRSRRSTA